MLPPAINISLDFVSVVVGRFLPLDWASLCSAWADLQHEAERTAPSGSSYFINSDRKVGFGYDLLSSSQDLEWVLVDL